jgi:hypothetical protein
MNFDLAPIGRILIVIILLIAGLFFGLGYSIFDTKKEVKTKEPIKPIRIEISVDNEKPDTTYVYKQY